EFDPPSLWGRTDAWDRTGSRPDGSENRSSSRLPLRPRQPGDEGPMLGGRQAPLQDPDQPAPILGEERLGIQPQAREDLGTIDPIRTGGQVLEVLAAADEPVNAVRFQRDDQVFEDTRPL